LVDPLYSGIVGSAGKRY